MKNDIIKSIREDIEKGDLNLLLNNITNNEKIDIEIFESDIIYQITSTYNQNNYKYHNISIIKLQDCENRLKIYYNISLNSSLIIFKVDIYEEGLSIPIVEYEVYHPITYKKLNLDICSNITIDILLPVSIDENELYKYDPSSDFYNDKCFPYTSENGTDVILKDRQLLYANNNLSLCEDNCEYVSYDNLTKYATCNCEIKNTINITDDYSFDRDKLLKKFMNIESMINLEVIKCYKYLLTKEGIIKNIGSYILLSTIIIFIICLIIFILKGYNSLINKINLIFQQKKNENRISMKQNFTEPFSNEKKIIKKRKKKYSKFRNKNNGICITEKNSLKQKNIKKMQKNTNFPPKKKY